MTDITQEEQLKQIINYILDDYLRENKQYFSTPEIGTLTDQPAGSNVNTDGLRGSS